MKLEKVTELPDLHDERMTKRWYDDACGTALALEFVGERWSLLVMRELMYGPRRFGEIRANLPGISANVLTQRLEGLAAAGIVERRRLSSPANIQVYDLTDWGREAGPVIRDMGRWAARSPRHDPMLFMSTASAMMSLETLVDRAAIGDAAMTVAIRFPDDAFVVRVGGGVLAIRRGETEDADVRFAGDTMALRRTVYGKAGVNGDGLLSMAGDAHAGEEFLALFALPEKIG